ncbi:MAG: hypothetical protein JWM35_1051 [Verrucomicrobia bacterium]|nr:hypothetical protein [Verrucomicrobiota bacterium]
MTHSKFSRSRFFSLAAAMLVLGAMTLGAQTPAPAPAPVYGKAADNKIYAQQLVMELLAENLDLGGVGLHAVPPGKKDYEIVGQTRDLIGKKSSADDIEVIERDAVKIYPFVILGEPRFSALAAIRDSSGKIVGMAALSFKRVPGVDRLTVHARVVTIMIQLAAKIPSQEALFKPIP